jgi:hypothetical protein
MAKTQKRKVPKPSQQTTEQRMLRAHRAELRRSQRLAADVSAAARQLRSAMRRADSALSDLRDDLLEQFPLQQSLGDIRQERAAGE